MGGGGRGGLVAKEAWCCVLVVLLCFCFFLTADAANLIELLSLNEPDRF